VRLRLEREQAFRVWPDCNEARAGAGRAWRGGGEERGDFAELSAGAPDGGDCRFVARTNLRCLRSWCRVGLGLATAVDQFHYLSGARQGVSL
jgi:hypothetical protein